MSNGLANDRETIYIISAFNNWHSVTATIHSISLQEKGDHGVVISGSDCSKRYLVSPMSKKLHTFLLILAFFNRDILVNNVLFNIEKKFIIPQFNLKQVDHPFLPIKIIDSVIKNKRNKNSRDLHIYFHIENVSSEVVNVKEQSNEPFSSVEKPIANCSILPIPFSQWESLAIHERNSLYSGLGVSEDSNKNVTSIPSVSEQGQGQAKNNFSFDPNQKRNYHISTRIRSNSCVCVCEKREIYLTIISKYIQSFIFF